MTRAVQPMPPDPRRFKFELTVQATKVLPLSAGELAVFILDGLFALDDEDMLFAAVAADSSGARIAHAGIEVIGYTRPAELPGANPAYHELMARKGRRRGGGDKELAARLRAAAAALHARLPQQRLLIAELRSHGDLIAKSDLSLEHSAVRVAALLDAAETATAAIKAAITPIIGPRGERRPLP